MAKSKKVKKTARKFAKIKARIGEKDNRMQRPADLTSIPKKEKKELVKDAPKVNSAMFFQANENMKPPYHILMDTNFINFSVQNKLDILSSLMDCMNAKCIPCVSDCVIGELEKFGSKCRLALRLAKDPRFKRLTCQHKGTYADDCIVDRVNQHRCYIVGTADKELRQRIRKIPGVPLMRVERGKYSIERIPDQIPAVPSAMREGKKGK